MSPESNGIRPLLSGSNANGLLDRHDKDLAVADLLSPGGVLDRLHGAFDERVVEHHLDLDLWQKVYHVFCPAIDFGMPFLPAEALDLADGHAGHADLVQRVFYLVELERLDDRFDLLHGLTIASGAQREPGLGSASSSS